MKISAPNYFRNFPQKKLSPFLQGYCPISKAKFEQDKKQTKQGMFSRSYVNCKAACCFCFFFQKKWVFKSLCDYDDDCFIFFGLIQLFWDFNSKNAIFFAKNGARNGARFGAKKVVAILDRDSISIKTPKRRFWKNSQ